ncbi:hypothetical protein M885DRAFT_550504 [Pelagophyceae sp. CCMP2097]|nr:hypothetical protein M885DRAFT_550504 [Pelagophyceae sp. CCMP2097]
MGGDATRNSHRRRATMRWSLSQLLSAGLLCLSVGAWWTLLAPVGTIEEHAVPTDCDEILRGALKSRSYYMEHWNHAWFGVGVFATRRYYHQTLAHLQNCTDMLAAELHEDVCPLAVALSEWRVLARDEARARSNLFARRLSHFLECGLSGWIVDCEQKPSDWYFQHYYKKTFAAECAARGTPQPEQCEPLCRHLLKASARSRRSVDYFFSKWTERSCRAIIASIVLCAAIGLFTPAAFYGRPLSVASRQD